MKREEGTSETEGRGSEGKEEERKGKKKGDVSGDSNNDGIGGGLQQVGRSGEKFVESIILFPLFLRFFYFLFLYSFVSQKQGRYSVFCLHSFLYYCAFTLCYFMKVFSLIFILFCNFFLELLVLYFVATIFFNFNSF